MYRCGSAARYTADSCQELIDAKPKSIYRTFPFFFFSKTHREGTKSKKGLFNGRHTQKTMGALTVRKWTRLRSQVLYYVTSHRKSAPLPSLWPVFRVPRASFDTQSVLLHFLPNICLRKSGFLKFSHARPQCVVLHTLVLMYSCSNKSWIVGVVSLPLLVDQR